MAAKWPAEARPKCIPRVVACVTAVRTTVFSVPRLSAGNGCVALEPLIPCPYSYHSCEPEVRPTVCSGCALWGACSGRAVGGSAEDGCSNCRADLVLRAAGLRGPPSCAPVVIRALAFAAQQACHMRVWCRGGDRVCGRPQDWHRAATSVMPTVQRLCRRPWRQGNVLPSCGLAGCMLYVQCGRVGRVWCSRAAPWWWW